MGELRSRMWRRLTSGIRMPWDVLKQKRADRTYTTQVRSIAAKNDAYIYYIRHSQFARVGDRRRSQCPVSVSFRCYRYHLIIIGSSKHKDSVWPKSPHQKGMTKQNGRQQKAVYCQNAVWVTSEAGDGRAEKPRYDSPRGAGIKYRYEAELAISVADRG